LTLIIVLAPLLAALGAYALRSNRQRFALLLTTAVVHSSAVLVLWIDTSHKPLRGWLAADSLGLIVLTVVSVVFLMVAQYAVSTANEVLPRGGRAYVSCLLLFLAATSLVALSQHMALLWVGMEATTLSVAPLIFDRHDRRSLEAVWKYLILSSVGIAMALLAVFLLATAQSSASAGRPLLLPDLIRDAARLDQRWLRAAFVFALVGFGTKMGLAPLHSWKPDTYGEAPSLVGALMSSALTSCAFLGLARFTQVAVAAGLQPFIRPILIGFGLLSLLVAAAFILGQADVKRLLAYSSVEHMGLLALGLGLGGVATYGSVLHLINNGLVKAMMFLTIGNLVMATGSSVAADLRGMLLVRPWSAGLLLAGMFAVTGSPPFGMFISVFAIISGALRHHAWVAGSIVLLLAIIFVGIAAMVVTIVYGEPVARDSRIAARESDRRALIVGPALLTALVLMLGLYIPGPLRVALASAAKSLGDSIP